MENVKDTMAAFANKRYSDIYIYRYFSSIFSKGMTYDANNRLKVSETKKILGDYDINLQCPESGYTVAHYAVRQLSFHDVAIIRQYIRKGGNPNLVDHDGFRFWDLACKEIYSSKRNNIDIERVRRKRKRRGIDSKDIDAIILKELLKRDGTLRAIYQILTNEYQRKFDFKVKVEKRFD